MKFAFRFIQLPWKPTVLLLPQTRLVHSTKRLIWAETERRPGNGHYVTSMATVFSPILLSFSCSWFSPVLTLGSWQLLAAASFKAVDGTLLRLLGRWQAIEGVVTLRRKLLPIRTWEVELLAVLLLWFPMGLWTVWAEPVLELLMEERKVGGAEVEVGWLARAEADGVEETLNPL